ncbi:MAG TPA: resolvase [Methanobacteriaceae archaeon]|nr:resolvase [Methanobacteriaceae archaeon]
MGYEIHVSKPLTSQKIMELLDKNPELRKITCPPSLYKRIPTRYLDVEVEPIEKLGRPRKYGGKERDMVGKMFKQGYTPQEISNTLNIPLKTVYYLNKTPLKKGRKPKYSPETVRKVKSSHQEGVSAKEISEKLDIPLRSVYSLLKRRYS